jgi:hypothetical protein
MSAVALLASEGALFPANLPSAVREAENSKGVCLALQGYLPGQAAGLVQRSGPVHRFDVAPLAFEHNLVTHLARELSNGGLTQTPIDQRVTVNQGNYVNAGRRPSLCLLLRLGSIKHEMAAESEGGSTPLPSSFWANSLSFRCRYAFAREEPFHPEQNELDHRCFVP